MTLRDSFLPLGAATALAFSLVITRRYIDLGSNPQSVMIMRFAALAAMSGIWAAAAGVRLPLPATRRLETYAMGLVFLGAPTCYVTASTLIPVGLAALLFYLHPIITMLISAAIDRSRPGLAETAAFALAFLGIAVALQAPFGDLDPLGMTLAVCGGACVTLNFQWTSRRVREVDTRIVTLHAGLGALGALCAYFATFGGFVVPTGGGAPWLTLAAVLLSYNLGIILMYMAVRAAGPVKTAMILNLEAPLTILFAVLILDERIAAAHAVGAGLVLAALMLARRRPERRPPTGVA